MKLLRTMFAIVWVLWTACFTLASTDQNPFNLAPIIHVNRNWKVSPSAPIGSVVTKVDYERNGNITLGLETSGSPVPFTIDPHTGVVTVNDTLNDKVDTSYSLWVTAYDDSDDFIPQRTEVVAVVTDKDSFRPTRPPIFQQFPKYPGLPTAILATTHRIIAEKPQTNFNEEEDTFEASTTTEPKTSKIPVVTSNDNEEIHDAKENIRNNITVIPPQNSDLPLAIISPVAIGGIIVIVAIAIIFFRKKKIRKEKNEKDDMNKDPSAIILQTGSLNLWERPLAYSNRYESWDNNHLQATQETSISKEEPRDIWEIPRHRLIIFNIVGEGAFGQVYRAQAIDIDGKKGETTVAVKTLKKNAAQEEKTDLLKELALMKSLGTHPNVVRLIGCCTEMEPTLVIMEFVSLGKLQQFLRDSRAERHYGNTHGDSQYLTSTDLTRFAHQVARGMDFLSSKGIIHRDLAARNVLITEERTCKVADFGFARDVAETQVYERKSGGRLPIRWMAPESLYDDIFSVKSDVWSFGVLLWEIVTLGSTPYPGLSAGDVMQKVRDGHRLEKPEHCRRELYNIMYYCWEAEPSARPDFKEIVVMLERLLCTETDYIELERFPDHSYYNVPHLEGEKL